MGDSDSLDYKERSLDEIFGNLASDVQGEQFNQMRYTSANTPSVPRMGQDFANENADPSFVTQRSTYYQENYPSQQTGSMPLIFNSREDILPGMVGVNYVVVGANNQQNQSPNINLSKKTNGTLSGLMIHDLGIEYPNTDYNLFNHMSPSRHGAVPQFPHATEANPRTQLIENLVGNWTSDQSGTYSPFGSPLGSVRSQSVTDHVGIGTPGSKTRMVAEVRPMRPSYSDVLSKSITNNNQKANYKMNSDTKQKMSEFKIKSTKSFIGRTLSGNGNILNRQHSAGVDDSNLTGSLKGSGLKKLDCENEVQEGMPKKWSSLDDLKDASLKGDYMNDNRYKKNNLKNSNLKNTRKDKWETLQLNNAKNAGTKATQAQRKSEKSNLKSQKEKENNMGPKFDPSRNKNVTADEKRAQATNQNKADQQKAVRRNLRNAQPEKHRKSQKGKRRDQEPNIIAVLKLRMNRYGGILFFALRWLFRLVLDVLSLSTHLALHMCAGIWASTVLNISQAYSKLSHSIRNIEIFQRIIDSGFSPFRKGNQRNKNSDSDDESDDSGDGKVKGKIPRGLKRNISLPVTGEEAMKRLLACKGKDPYSILGVTQDCTDDDIKKYYKRQAFLVHPDKNNQPGAEEAFKILVHAFDIIGEPEHRKSYDRTVEKTQVEQAAWSELSDLLSQLHKKMEYVANTIRCTNCSKRHKRTTVDRPIYAARMCSQCKIHHSVREGDIWAETSLFGFLWHYYACMDGAVYDITEWAGCQGSNLRNLKANTHNVQYRIVLGKQQGQKARYQNPAQTSEPYLEDFLNNLYTKSDSSPAGPETDPSSSASGRKRKMKRKK